MSEQPPEGQGELFPASSRTGAGDRPAKPAESEDTSLRDSFLRKLTGRAKGAMDREQKKSLPDRVGWLEKKHKGDEKAAAKAAGVALSTWRRWRSGKQKPSAKSVEKLDRATREALIPAGRRKRIEKSTGRGKLFTAPPSGGATITGWIRVSSDDRPRQLNLGANLPEGRMNEVVNAYLERGEEGAIEELQQIIREYLGGGADSPYGGDFEITNVTHIDLGPLG